MNKRIRLLTAATAIAGTGIVWVGELGHYGRGIMNICYFAVPEPGFYSLLYNYVYNTDTLKDRDGDEVGTLSRTGPLGTTRTVTVDPDIDVSALVPAWPAGSPHRCRSTRDDGGASAAQRARAGDVLVALGDPRFDPDRFHLPADDRLGRCGGTGSRRGAGKRALHDLHRDQGL